jgi:1,4-alpha-glucan branching enzyme
MRTVADQLQYIHIKKEIDMAALEVVKSMKESLRKHRTIGTKHEIEFTFTAPKAKKVCIAGNFNDWNMTSMPMKKSADGIWKIKLKLSPGKYEYKFVVDGMWVNDFADLETAPNPFGTCNCFVSVW